MSFSILAVLIILSAALVFFITGLVRMEVVALLVLASLALLDLVTLEEALAGFSSPAVITVWSMFILSAALSKTGIAYLLGRPLQRFAYGREVWLMLALMVAGSLLSVFINTVTVAVLLLPATMDLARRSGRSPSRLLMPLAMGCLLGGPFTAISTPPNILVTDALRAAGLTPFRLFDFTPITAAIVAAGIAYMILIGRSFLPDRVSDSTPDFSKELGRSYKLEEFLSTARVEKGSPLAGQTLRQSRLGSALHLSVVAVLRGGSFKLGPGADEILKEGDSLILHGRPDHLERFQGHEHLRVEEAGQWEDLLGARLWIAEGLVGEDSPLVGSSLRESGLRREYGAHVLAMVRGDQVISRDLPRLRIEGGDRLRLCGERTSLERVAEEGFVELTDSPAPLEVAGGSLSNGLESFVAVRVPSESVLVDRDLASSRLGNAFGLTVVGIVRGEELVVMPFPEEIVHSDDLLLLQGSPGDLGILQGLQQLSISPESRAQLAELESQEVGVTEILLSPRSNLAGKSLADLRFRERYGLSVLAVWRERRPHRSGLQDLRLQFGDALLVYGHRRNIEALARDPDFLVLDPSAAEVPRLEKAPLAAGIMLAVLAAAMLGWAPISIAALTGAALVVLVGCVSMDEAYRAIDWKVVFLIAGMLPLGAAIEGSGVAQLGADALMGAVGQAGPRVVIATLFLVTVLATQVIPTAALVVLMAPVALNASASLGISPHLLMMTVAMAASSSFASPVSHPAHILIMGPGGYRFVDYVKVGAPLTAVSFLVVVLLLPILWPP
jgi:di/tricarboxylate transporter